MLFKILIDNPYVFGILFYLYSPTHVNGMWIQQELSFLPLVEKSPVNAD
jgi:hypothetical protein